MFALYSKAFAKSAVDINKKEFRTPKDGKEVLVSTTAKGGSGGIDFELNAKNKAKACDLTITVPVDDKCKASLKTDAEQSTEVTFDLSLADGMTMKAIVGNPSMKMATSTVTAEFEYLDPGFSVETKMALFDGANGLGLKGTGFSAAVAMPCPGLDGVTVGFSPAVGFGGASPVVNIPFSIGTGDKTKAAAFTGTLAAGGGSPVPTAFGLKGFFKVNSSTSVGAEFDYLFSKTDAKALWKAPSALNAEKGDAPFTVKAAVEYKANSALTLKAKGTYTDKLALDFAAKSALEGKSSFVVATTVNAAAAPSVSFTYNLEA